MAEKFEVIFTRLRDVMLTAAKGMVINKDVPGGLELRTSATDPKTKQLGWFGTVTTKKTYVAYHLMQLYTHPELASKISPELAKRMQGKTCFNFSKCDEILFQELGQLTQACAKRA